MNSIDETFNVVAAHPLLMEAVVEHNKNCPSKDCAWQDIEDRFNKQHGPGLKIVFAANAKTNKADEFLKESEGKKRAAYARTAGEEAATADVDPRNFQAAEPVGSTVTVFFSDNKLLNIHNVVDQGFAGNYEEALVFTCADGEIHTIPLHNVNHIAQKGG